MRDKPWLMRTYSGHSSARASNELYRSNLAKGQTGLSVAFDLPTQTGYDADHPLATGEVGKVGVPVPYLGAMRTLFDGIPLDEMNTSMTINATAMWLFGMYVALAEERGVDPARLAGTTQNDIVKEYLSRGTYIFGPEPSRRLTVDLVCHAVRHVPKWNPINVCSYHLQEAGATPVEEVAYALATAIDVLDAVRESGQVSDDEFPEVVGRISFFVNAGIRFVEEMCKLRAFGVLWDRITAERYGVTDDKLRRFRYGVQVNSLGLTEAQPENNVQRIVLETLGVTLSKGARARAVQLPAWNEALGLPRPWDQQWSLRIQQVLAFETDLLEYDDIFAGSHVVEATTAELAELAEVELAWVLDGGGAFAMIDAMKHRLVQSNAERVRRIESGEITVVGVNQFAESADSPLVESLDGESTILVVDEEVEREQIALLEEWRAARDADAVARALDAVRETARGTDNLTPATIELARAGGTVGEWAGALRDVFGEYRAPTGVGGVRAPLGEAMVAARAAGAARAPRRSAVRSGSWSASRGSTATPTVPSRSRSRRATRAWRSSTRASGSRPSRSRPPHATKTSTWSASPCSPDRTASSYPRRWRCSGPTASTHPSSSAASSPKPTSAALLAAGVARVYTPKDFRVSDIVAELAELVTVPS